MENITKSEGSKRIDKMFEELLDCSKYYHAHLKHGIINYKLTLD